MNKEIFGESELILNNKGKIYHLAASYGEIAENIILVGDPNRVKEVSKYFDQIELKISNREIVTHTGSYNNKRLSVISTGMGPDNIDIVINELDALFNIDFSTRKEKNKKTSLNLIRVGTSGALQEDIPVESYILSTHGLGIDGLLNFYACRNNICEQDFEEAFIKHTSWNDRLGHPYIVPCSGKLIKKFDKQFLRGITITAAGFYGPQGRQLRLKAAFPDLIDKYGSFTYKNERITNFEMETSALYGLGKALDHNTLTACLIIANRITKKFCKNYHKPMEDLIQKVLDNITK
jgi:uridine phosphorylase